MNSKRFPLSAPRRSDRAGARPATRAAIPRRAAPAGALLLLLAVAASCAPAPRIAIVAPGGGARAVVSVEIADSSAKRERGLMFRTGLAQGAGMIFVFAAPSVLHFWMKNTAIPLDLIFAGADGQIVGIVAGAKPYSERPLGVGKLAQYVLEVNGGFCRRHNVTVGDRLRFVDFVPLALE